MIQSRNIIHKAVLNLKNKYRSFRLSHLIPINPSSNLPKLFALIAKQAGPDKHNHVFCDSFTIESLAAYIKYNVNKKIELTIDAVLGLSKNVENIIADVSNVNKNNVNHRKMTVNSLYSNTFVPYDINVHKNAIIINFTA